MQLGKSGDDLTARSALYAAMLLSAQSRKGHQYKEIKRVYQIFFLNCILFPDSKKIPHRYQYLEETEHTRLTDAVEIIFYELPKLEQRVQEVLKEETDLKTLLEDEKWCIFMKYHHEERAAELIEKLCREEAGIMNAERAVRKASRDYERFARKMAIIKNSMDRASEIYDAKMEGQAIGKAEGKTETNLEIARKMKAMGDSAEKIHAVTGLEMEIINNL